MTDHDALSLVRYQTGLFSALTGVLVTRGVISRIEIAAALAVVADDEQDLLLRRLYQNLIGAVLLTGEAAGEKDFFK